MNPSYAFDFAHARLSETERLDLDETCLAILAGDFADRCAGDVPGFPSLPKTDNVRDEWSAYLRDIGTGNLAKYARMLLSCELRRRHA